MRPGTRSRWATVVDHGWRHLLGKTKGVRWLRRQATPTTPEFDLAYIRTGPRGKTPVLIIPGGPGLGSVLPYRSLRKQANADGLDVLMVEHRGVGLSRTDTTGQTLPHQAMWVDAVLEDLVAVLDAQHVEKVYLAGSSYGSYLASAFAARYPERVEGLLLDSALQSTKDIQEERRRIREIFLGAQSPVADQLQALLEAGQDDRILLDVVRAAYELDGMELVEAAVKARLKSEAHPLWVALKTYATRDASIFSFPGFFEFGLAGAIGFRELDYGATPDGLPLDPALTYSQVAEHFPKFFAEPYDLVQEVGRFQGPVVTLIGSRDVRTPPSVGQRTAGLAQDSTAVFIDNGHAALDTHPVAFVKALKMLVNGKQEHLPDVSEQLSALPKKGLAQAFTRTLRAMARI